MTFAEINRVIASAERKEEKAQKERAVFDYILASQIGCCVARAHSEKNKVPQIEEVYPFLFTSEEIEEQKEKKRQDLSVMRFRAFAAAHNIKFKNKEVAVKDE